MDSSYLPPVKISIGIIWKKRTFEGKQTFHYSKKIHSGDAKNEEFPLQKTAFKPILSVKNHITWQRILPDTPWIQLFVITIPKKICPTGGFIPTANCSIHRSPKPQEGDLFRHIPGWGSATWKAISYRSSMVLGPDFWWFYHPVHETRKDFRQPYLQGKNPWIGPFFLFRVQFNHIKNIIWK